MQATDLIRPEHVIPHLAAPSKAALLQALSGEAAGRLGLDADAVCAALCRREALGSTGVGDRVAIPHAPIAGLKRPFGLLARLDRPVAFDAIDGEPVDIVCLLLTPCGGGRASLDALACIARRLRAQDVRDRIRRAGGRREIHAALHEAG